MSSRAGRSRRQVGLRKLIVSMLALTLLGSVLTASGSVGAQTTGPFPWESLDPSGDDAVGAGFVVTMRDLDFIMQGIKIAEAHAAAPVTDPVNDPYNCGALIGDGPDQIPPGANAEELPWGLRTLQGVCNNLVPGQENFGAAEFDFPRLTTPVYRDAQVLQAGEDVNGPAFPNVGDLTSYDLGTQPTGFVRDDQPRLASNLIVDQSDNNPAASIAAGEAPAAVPTGDDRDIPNVAPDEGLSAPYNDMFTFFGQFFDHGLDLTTKSGGDFVFVPLRADDPLLPTAGATPFMILQRAEGPNGLPTNLTSPFVDQNQTYASHPSHQVFLREWVMNAASRPTETGHLIESGINGGGMSTWADVKAQAASMLGIQLTDHDVLSIPLLAADLYGNFIPGPNGFPQIVLDDDTLLEGDPTANGGAGVLVPANAVSSGHAFLDDIAHHAVPGMTDPLSCPGPVVLKTGVSDGLYTDDGDCTTYDIDLLETHFMAGDGRVNENIALTAVHHVLHSEHNRLVEQFKLDLVADGTASRLADWQLAPGLWNGQRLFQAAKFATEMEYQHLVFEEFGRKVQPLIDIFASYETSIDASIVAEAPRAEASS